MFPSNVASILHSYDSKEKQSLLNASSQPPHYTTLRLPGGNLEVRGLCHVQTLPFGY